LAVTGLAGSELTQLTISVPKSKSDLFGLHRGAEEFELEQCL
jgi:hypothetical protein